MRFCLVLMQNCSKGFLCVSTLISDNESGCLWWNIWKRALGLSRHSLSLTREKSYLFRDAFFYGKRVFPQEVGHCDLACLKCSAVGIKMLPNWNKKSWSFLSHLFSFKEDDAFLEWLDRILLLYLTWQTIASSLSASPHADVIWSITPHGAPTMWFST